MSDLSKRATQCLSLADTELHAVHKMGVWLGGLCAPEAFLTAARQEVAQKNGWSLEDVGMTLRVGDFTNEDNHANMFLLRDMGMEGAGWDAETECLSVSNVISSPLPLVTVTWMCLKDLPSAKDGEVMIELPVYLNHTRSQLLFTVKLPASESIPVVVWQQRGACLVAWTQ